MPSPLLSPSPRTAKRFAPLLAAAAALAIVATLAPISPATDAQAADLGVEVRTDITHEDANRIFPGLHRSLTAALAAPLWSVDTEDVTLTSDGSTAVITGIAAGSAAVTASQGAKSGRLDVTVLQPLTRITASSALLALDGVDDTAVLTITGHDALGFEAPIDPIDVQISDAPADLLEFTPSSEGTFEVRAKADLRSASVTFTVGQYSVAVPITVGSTEVLFTDLADADKWGLTNDRAEGGTMTPVAGHDGDHGLTLAYDFTQSTATRGQYAVTPGEGITLPGQPQKITMWIYGDGNGAWPRLQFGQPNGTTSNLDGAKITWTGWQQAEFLVPAGVEYPLTFERFRLMETRAEAQYTGEITISSLAVAVAPDVDIPAPITVEDPIVVADGETDDAPLRVAVLSDAQFVARDPESETVAGAHRALQEIVASDPDVLVINGDFVDEASPADFALAREILDEELGDVSFPWYYSPGNHEVMGGEISNFTDEFGDRFRTVDMDRTRIIMLDSSDGSITGDAEQLEMLKTALADATTSSAVTGVLLLQHHPIDDPLPTKASQLTNREDAEFLRGLLEDFRQTSGKSVAFVGSHVGVFHAKREDGIAYLVNGNSGKTPAGSLFGDFTGWTMLGIDPDAGLWGETSDDWLQVEVQTRVDSISLNEIGAELLPGGQVSLHPTIAQPGRDEIVVKWPMSFRWTGSDGVYIGPAGNAPATAIATLDPTTHVLTSLAPGLGSVTLAVNGVSKTIDFVIAGDVATVVPTLQVSSDEVEPGDQVTVSGADFTVDQQIELWLHSDPVLLGEATTGADGTFALTVDVPSDVPAGAHTLRVTDPTTGIESSVALTVRAAAAGTGDATDTPTATDTDAAQTDRLSETGGGPSLALLALGIVLLAAGGIIATWRIRRRA